MRQASPRSARSLGRWLSWWLACLTLGGLAVVCAGVYLATSLSLAARQRDELTQQEEVVRHLLAEASAARDGEDLVHKLNDFFVGHDDLVLTLHGSDGTLVYTNTPSLDAAPAQGDGTPRAETGPGTSPAVVRRFDFGAAFAPGGRVTAELALDAAPDAQVLRRLGWTLLCCAVLGALLVSAGGFWLVRRAMSPVRALAVQTAQLGAARLGQRLDGSAQAEELQPLVQQFNQLLDRLEQAYTEMEGFNTDVAHELRTPLTTLIGECELALGGSAGQGELREVLGSNLEELHRLAAVVKSMLFLSQASRGAVARRTPVAGLAQLVGQVIEFHDAALQEAGLETAVIGDAGGEFDAPLLQQALSNLLSNATRFATRGTTVVIEIAARPDGHVAVVVSNIGPTIDLEHLPRLFDRFYRADPSRAHGDANHGLGLSIVAAIARMHGGGAQARSGNGQTAIGFDITPR